MEGKDIVVFGGVDWFNPSKLPIHHLVEKLSKKNRVFYIDNFGTIRDLKTSDFSRVISKLVSILPFKNKPQLKTKSSLNSSLHVVQPMLFPSPRLPSFIGSFNSFLLKRCLKGLKNQYDIQNPIVWTRVPTKVVWQSINVLNPQVLLYQSVDKFPESPMIPASLKDRFRESEYQFNCYADLVFCSAKGLYNEKKQFNKNTLFFPNGVDTDKFIQGATQRFGKKGQKQSIIFVGNIGPWVDISLLAFVSDALAEVEIKLIGPVDPSYDISVLHKKENIRLLGRVAHDDLPGLFAEADVGLIPYKLSDFTNYTFPSKMAEYLASGMPLVTTNLPEVNGFSEMVMVSDSKEDFVRNIQSALIISNKKSTINQCMSDALKLSWDEILHDMETEIERVLDAKACVEQ